MKVEVTTLDQVRKKVEVILPEEKVKELEEGIYDELKKQAKIKGFRPGKTPKSIIAAYYKDYVDDELKKRMVQATMAEALSTAKITPVDAALWISSRATGSMDTPLNAKWSPS